MLSPAGSSRNDDATIRTRGVRRFGWLIISQPEGRQPPDTRVQMVASSFRDDPAGLSIRMVQFAFWRTEKKLQTLPNIFHPSKRKLDQQWRKWPATTFLLPRSLPNRFEARLPKQVDPHQYSTTHAPKILLRNKTTLSHFSPHQLPTF